MSIDFKQHKGTKFQAVERLRQLIGFRNSTK